MSSGQRGERLLARPVRLLPPAVLALGLGSLVLAVAGRFWFPWPLEWMEGASLQHALRLLEGRPIYGPPAADFIPFMYPPLAYLPMAVAAALLGPTLPAARLPSLLALAGTLYFVGRAAARAGGGRQAAALGSGLFALGYGYGVVFLDLARVDSLFLLLLAAGTERLLAGRSKTALVLFLLSCLAKQQGLLFLFAASLWLLWQERRAHLAWLAGAWGALALVWGWLHLASSGWFTVYVLKLPLAHGIIWKLLPLYLLYDVLLLLPVLSLAALVELWRNRRRPRAVDLLLLAALVSSALARAHTGGHENVLLPGFALLCVAGSARLCAVLSRAGRPGAAQLAIAAAVLVQCLILFQPPTAHWPTAQSERRFRHLSRSLALCAGGGGSHAALDHSLLGNRPLVHTMALSDLRASGHLALGRQATRALLDAFSAADAPGALAVGASFPELDRELRRRYRVCARPAPPVLATGFQPPASTVWRKKEP